MSKIRKRRKRTAKNTKNRGKKIQSGFEESVRLDSRERERGICKKAYAEAVRRNQRQRYWKFLFSFFFFSPPPFHPIKTPPVFPGREKREERGKGRFESVAAFPLFSTSLLRFARGNVTLVSCYFSNPLRGYIKRLRKVGQSSPFSSSTLGLRTIRITDF